MPSAKTLKTRYKRKQIAKKIINGLLLIGAICLAGSGSPTHNHVFRIIDLLSEISFKESWAKFNSKEKKQIRDTFSYLRKIGLIELTRDNYDIHISLTEEGKKQARQYQIDELEIIRPKIWDKKWRILLFDIPEESRIKRDTLRFQLKKLGFFMIQRSVWVHAFPCSEELEMLKDFFNFKKNHYVLIETSSMGHHEHKLLNKFNIKTA